MLNFVKSAYSFLFKVRVWITLIVLVIGGLSIGFRSGDFLVAIGFREGNFLLAIVGMICGLLVTIILNGIEATVLSINNNLELLTAKIPSTGDASVGSSFGSTHRVKLLTDADGLGLRKEPDASVDPFTTIPNNTEVQQINTGGLAKLGDKEGEWFEIMTKDGVQGWCFSGSLEKI
jgi:hypothetical protein